MLGWKKKMEFNSYGLLGERADHGALNAFVSISASTINRTTSADAKNVIDSHINNKWYSHLRNHNMDFDKLQNITNQWLNPELNRKRRNHN